MKKKKKLSKTPVKKTPRVPETARRILFLFSGNKCAAPNCTKNLAEKSAKSKDFVYIGQVCHIIPKSKKGPRSQYYSDIEDVNHPSNLILLCPNHHNVIDKNPDDYTPETLRNWKETHELQYYDTKILEDENIDPSLFLHQYFPKNLVNSKINEEIDQIRKLRRFQGFNLTEAISVLVRQVTTGILKGGSEGIKSNAIAWCARINSMRDIELAKKLLIQAKKIGNCEQSEIAEAFINHSNEKFNQKTLLKSLKLDTPMKKSAALLIIRNQKGAVAANNWFNETGFEIEDLDSDGKFVFLLNQLELKHSKNIQLAISKITEADFENEPILYRHVALAYIMLVTPDWYRSHLIQYLPFTVRQLQSLYSDDNSLKLRENAQKLFENSASFFKKHNLNIEEAIDDYFAIWLGLENETSKEKYKSLLKEKLCNSSCSLKFVPLGIHYIRELDIEKIETDIERIKATKGELNYDAAMARISLVLRQNDIKASLNYISKYREELKNHINWILVENIYIESLVKNGLFDEAQQHLEMLKNKGLPADEEEVFEAVIKFYSTNFSVDKYIESYNKNKKETGQNLEILQMLVSKLKEANRWKDLCTYGKELFERDPGNPYLEDYLYALTQEHKFETVISVVRKIKETDNIRESIKYYYFESLYYLGKFLELDNEYKDTKVNRNIYVYLELELRLKIAMGCWEEVQSIVQNVSNIKETLTPNELLRIAHIATSENSSYTRELIEFAAQKGKSDPDILARAYLLAVRNGWDLEDLPNKWFHEATKMSDEAKQFKKISINEMMDSIPKWNESKMNIDDGIRRGELPFFLAEGTSGLSLTNLILCAAHANRRINDPRRRAVIPAFSGSKRSSVFSLKEKSVGLDVTSILTLGYLGILETLINSCSKINVSHSTLSWLFDEKQKITFHQPSRIVLGEKIQRLLARGVVEVFESTIPSNLELSSIIDEELSEMIVQAQFDRNENNSQSFVVIGGPIYKNGTLLDEELELDEYSHILCDCSPVIEKLNEIISVDDFHIIRSKFSSHDKPRKNQPVITEGAMLYLNDLATLYFVEQDLCNKLNDAGFKICVSKNFIDESNKIVEYKELSDVVIKDLSRIRKILKNNIYNKRINVGPINIKIIQRDSKEYTFTHPTSDLFTLVPKSDILVIDDRTLNAREKFLSADYKVPVYSSIDLLLSLESEGVIETKKMYNCFSKLRSVGFKFVPFYNDEIYLELKKAEIHDGQVREVGNLRTIANYLFSVRMDNWLQNPKEFEWFRNTVMEFSIALKKIWNLNENIESIKTRSNWILDQIELSGWAHFLNNNNEEDFWYNRKNCEFLVLFLMFPSDISEDRIFIYWEWIENRLLEPIRYRSQEAYSNIVASYIDLFIKSTEAQKEYDNDK